VILADAAVSPDPAAAAASATATAAASAPAASAAASATAAAATASAPPAAARKLLPKPRRSCRFLVEDIERAQADVGDFLLVERDLRQGGIRGWHQRCIGRHSSRCRGCAADKRQRHADRSQNRYCFLPMLSLRNLPLTWHVVSSHALSDIRRPFAIRTPCRFALQDQLGTRTAIAIPCQRAIRTSSSPLP
jgi:hypothetical protein